MSVQHSVLGTASARWNDYLGTAAADEADASLGSPSLYSLVDLDRDRWTIVAVDVKIKKRRPAVTIYASDRSLAGDRPGEPEVTDPSDMPLPVSAFTLDRDQAAAFIDQGLPTISIRLTASAFGDHPLVVSDVQLR